MPLLEKGVSAVANRMPKVISPKVHAIIDYGVAGSFILTGILSWKQRHKKAAISSFIIAGTEITVAMLTDYPGGVTPALGFPTHLKIDAGLAGLIGSMPNFMGFSDEWPSWFFRSQGMAMAAVAGLSDTGGLYRERRYRRAA